MQYHVVGEMRMEEFWFRKHLLGEDNKYESGKRNDWKYIAEQETLNF